MTDKELHRLSRRELLQLLLTQAKDTEELRRLTEEQGEQLESLRNNYEHLKRRLDQKDAQIHELRTTLHEERSNRRIELEEAGSIAEAALRLNGIFETAQKAAEQYLYNIKLMHEKEKPHEREFLEEADFDTMESPEVEAADEMGMISSEEPERWGEEMAEPQYPEEDMTEIEPEFPEESGMETDPEFAEENMAESEPKNPEESVPVTATEEPEERSRGRKRRARHKK